MSVENVQQVRAVYESGEWRLHFVCRHVIDPDSPGDGVAGIDLGNANIAAVSFGDEAVLYPSGALKEDEYWFLKQLAPAVRLFDRSEGRFAPREQIVDREP